MLLKFYEPDAAIARLSGNALCLDCCWLIGFKRSSSPLKPMPGSIWCIPRAAAAGVSTRGTSYRLCRPDVLAIARCRALERRSAADRRTEWIIWTASSIPRWHCVRPKAAANSADGKWQRYMQAVVWTAAQRRRMRGGISRSPLCITEAGRRERGGEEWNRKQGKLPAEAVK